MAARQYRTAARRGPWAAFLALGWVLLVLGAGPAWAQGQVTLGPLEINGELGVGMENRSNIYLTESSEVSDYILMVNPSFKVHHKLSPTSHWGFSYQGVLAYYQDKSQNDWYFHQPRLEVELGKDTGFYVRSHEQYTLTEDPLGSENQFRLGIKTKRSLNQFFLAPGWRFGRLTRVEMRYYNRFVDYDRQEDQYQSYNENQLGGAFYYQIMPLTAAVLEMRYAMREYGDQPSQGNQDFTRYDILVGLSWDPSARLTGEFKLGWSQQDYDQERDYLGLQHDGSGEFMLEAELSWRYSSSLRFLATLVRRLMEGAAPGYSTYLETAASLGLAWQASPNFKFNTALAYGQHAYDALASFVPGRDDDLLRFHMEGEYSFWKYMFVKGRFVYDQRDSSLDGAGYTDTRYYLGLGGRF